MGKYKIENLRFAYNENNEVVKLSDATKKTKYYLYKDSNFELLYCSGEKLTYFKGVTGEYMNESPEHYEAKMKILSDGYFDVDGVRIQPFRVDAEKFVSKTKKPDVIFYNEDDTVLCIIEVLKTNAKTKEDIKEFINLNYTVYEYHCINQTTQLLCHSKEVETELQSKRNKYVRGRIDKFRDTTKKLRTKAEIKLGAAKTTKVKKAVSGAGNKINQAYRSAYMGTLGTSTRRKVTTGVIGGGIGFDIFDDD